MWEEAVWGVTREQACRLEEDAATGRAAHWFLIKNV